MPGSQLTLPADLFTFAWMMGMMYTTKLLDGLDGLVSGLGVIGFTVLAVYSLWRIEVNVAGNRARPFTERDHKFLHITQAVMVGAMLLLLFGLLFLKPTHMNAAQEEVIYSSNTGAMITLLVSGILVSTMARIHGKGKAAYDELEKGV